MVSRQKPDGSATSHAKIVGQWPDPKFDDYIKNSSDLQSKFKNQPQTITVELRILSHFVKFWNFI
jgi:hypothetical protein